MDQDDEIHNITIKCPTCNSKKNLVIPEDIISKSKQLTTISVPKGLVCEHTFQVFIDKNSKVRGYQKIDFEISNIDFYYKIGSTDEVDAISSPVIEITCPRCKKKMNVINEFGKEKKTRVITINNSIADHCGHEFLVYLDRSNRILGYSSIKNIDENEDLKDIFSKL